MKCLFSESTQGQESLILTTRKVRKTNAKCLFSEPTQGQALLTTRKEKRNKNFISVSFERRRSNLCLPQGVEKNKCECIYFSERCRKLII